MKGLLHAQKICHNLLVVDQYDFQNASEQVSLRIAQHLGAPERAAALSEYFSNHWVEHSSTHNPQLRLRLADTDWTDDQKGIFNRECGGMMTAFEYPL
jgi:hypothetical protein